jgi:phosphopantetheinyl transferase
LPILIKQNIDPWGEIGVWKITEEPSFFLDRLYVYPEEQKMLDKLKARKLIEWLSSRFLLHTFSGRMTRGEVLKDKYGKPYLKDSPYHISLSHSKDLAAIIASPSVVGIDIQYIVNKILRIGSKFISKEEYKLIPSDKDVLYHHLIWGAKECLFKAYGKGNVEFKKHLIVDNFELIEDQFIGEGRVVKDDFNESYRLVGNHYSDYIIVYAVQLDKK